HGALVGGNRLCGHGLKEYRFAVGAVDALERVPDLEQGAVSASAVQHRTDHDLVRAGGDAQYTEPLRRARPPFRGAGAAASIPGSPSATRALSRSARRRAIRRRWPSSVSHDTL